MKKFILSSLGAMSLLMADAQNATHTFNYGWTLTSAPQVYVVPDCVGKLRITARGAGGSKANSAVFAGGLGAHVSGDFNVTPGDTLLIMVGQNPSSGFSNPSINSSGGGGGGTFVIKSMNGTKTILAIAGGGGGGGSLDSPNKHGQSSTIAGNGYGGGSGMAGTNGAGGSNSGYSGAGGGYVSDGGTGYNSNMGGKSFINGGGYGQSNGGNGGYGGGGAALGSYSGGGGGGYNGGGGAGSDGVGGGGSSYNAGTNAIDSTGVNAGHGKVIIQEFPIAPNFNYLLNTQNIMCKGDMNGEAEVIVTGTNSPFKYNYSGLGYSNNNTISSLDAGNNYLVIKDACGNISDTTWFYIDEPSSYLDVTYTTIPGGNSNTGSIEFHVTGGEGPYQYSFDNGATFGPDNKLENLANDVYECVVADDYGCVKYYTIILEGYASQNEVDFGTLHIYPNPSSSYTNIKNAQPVNYRLMDMTGKVILLNDTFSENHVVNTNNLSNGVYLLQVKTTSSSVKTVKVVIK